MTDYLLSSLYLYLTGTCNLHCSHCWIAPVFSNGGDQGIPYEPLKNTILETVDLGLSSVKLTGGEPLLYPRFKELVLFLSKHDLSITIETNGMLLDDELALFLNDNNVSQISISLDSSDNKIHDSIRGRKGAFEKAVAAIKAAANRDYHCQVIMALQKKNAADLQNVITLCHELNAGSLKVNHLIPSGRAENIFSEKNNLELDELVEIYHSLGNEIQVPEELDVIFDLPPGFKPVEELKKGSLVECGILNILGILGSGDYSICGVGQVEESLRLGNIEKDSITHVWENNKTLIDLRDSLATRLTGVCGKCIFRFQCLGGCRANAYSVSGDLFAPYFLCSQLYEAGKFPLSRLTD